jgi:glyoxylase-like metal-dependent hydrolase (beta-lactamase superfamily II)
MPERFQLITKMPDVPGALHQAAKIIKHYNANINRIHYDKRIDLNIVFFEFSTTPQGYQRIKEGLAKIGYLQNRLNPWNFLKFEVYLPHRPGALFEFLSYTTMARANIDFLDFNDKGLHPEKLTLSLRVEDSFLIEGLINQLKSKYQIVVLEYNNTGEHLDETVFYLHFAQRLRQIIGGRKHDFLLKLLHDIDHIVQELTNLNQDPKKVFSAILLSGETLKKTTGNLFYADIQRFKLSPEIELFCFQPPCGGNIFVFCSKKEMVMLDTGFGIYYNDIVKMWLNYGVANLKLLKQIYVTHADADHTGAAGLFDAVCFMHEATKKAIHKTNRAYGSSSEGFVLEELYTKLINTFSCFTPPKKVILFPRQVLGMRHIFPVIAKFQIGPLEFEALESLGGHLYGQVFFLCPKFGLLFSGDSLINFSSLTEERKQFNTLAKMLMTSVNVDSEMALKERKALLEIVKELDQRLVSRRCLICGGHGTISVLNNDSLEVFGEIEHYSP